MQVLLRTILRKVFLVPLVSKTKEISKLKPPPPSPASNPSSFDQEHEQDIHENDEEAYQQKVWCIAVNCLRHKFS